MDIREWSQGSDVFKTITSDSETRHHTSNKKERARAKEGDAKAPRGKSIEQLNRNLYIFLDSERSSVAKRTVS